MKRWLALACGLLLAAQTGTAHGFHASLTSIDYVSHTKSLEITVVVNSDDLENAIRRATDRPIEIDRTLDAEHLVADYARQSVLLRTKEGAPVAVRWVGMEIKTNFVHLYLEATLPGGLAGLQLKNSILFDLLPDQVNMLSLKKDRQGRSSDHLFPVGSSFQTVDAAKLGL